MLLAADLLRTTPTFIKKLQKAGIVTTSQLLEYFPRALQDRSTVLRNFAFVDIREKNTIVATLDFWATEKTKFGKQILKALLRDTSGTIVEAVWFGKPFWMHKFQVGDLVLIYGKPTYKFGKLSFPSPDIEHFSDESAKLVPVYSELDGISSDWFAGKIATLRHCLTDIADVVPREIRLKNNHRTRAENIEAIHFPASSEDWNRARSELAYDELFRFQHAGLLRKQEGDILTKDRSFQVILQVEELKTIIAKLPFSLTEHQKIALFALLKDMEKNRAMNRLLQGDVGTGKTIVAFLAAWYVAHFLGAQTAFMVPTAVLAHQHFLAAKRFFEPLSLRVALLTGDMTKKEQNEIKMKLQQKEIDIVFWTHALLEEDVVFSSLGFVVIDEQHRFWVDQRRLLERKNTISSDGVRRVPHVLYMTATPIPRTLTLTIYGDQDVSVIAQYPANRKPIITRIFPETGRLEAIRFMEHQVEQGRQVYWISPLVEESEKLQYADVMRTTAMIREFFPDFQVEMIHGRMKSEEKQKIMQDFYAGKIQILSATSVIEVGVDNPNATVIAIEGADRFGLSQLHQFRGRVGRGQFQSYCFLFSSRSQENARLSALEKTNDGFELSEIDLELRGPGEVYGVRQSGIPDFQIADIWDLSLISQIREDIAAWMKTSS